MKKLSKIYQELINEDLEYAHVTDAGPETDVFEIGTEINESDDNFSKYLKYYSGDNIEYGKEHLKSTMNGLNELPDTIKLYRVVFLNDRNDLNIKELGSHYVLDQNQLEGVHYQQAHNGANGEPFILTVKASKNMIDYHNTIIYNMKYPNEGEVTLKNKGAGANLINIEPFTSNDEFDIGTSGFEDTYGEY